MGSVPKRGSADTEREGGRREGGDRIREINGFGQVRTNGREGAGSHERSSSENCSTAH